MDKKIKFTFKSEWVSWLTIVFVIIIAIWAYPRLPEMVPSHWNIAGEVDNYSSRLTHILLFPGITIGMYLLFLLIPYIEPRRMHFIKSWSFYQMIRNLMVVFMGLMFVITTWAGISKQPVQIGTIIPIMVGILFIFIGNYLSQIKSNFFMGIRTPWTLSSDEVWRKTHLVGGYSFVIGGLLFMASPLIPVPFNGYVPFIAIIIAALVPIIYSYIAFTKEKNNL